MDQVDAILLIGPTGSGKTPLGQALQHAGFSGRKVYHFDFGEHLRKASSSKSTIYGLSGKESQLIKRLLSENKLLPDGSLAIAKKIITGFMSNWKPSTVPRQRSTVNDQPIILLNGYPRNIRQAAMIDKVVRMMAVIELSASTEVVMARIKRDTGGDRAGRVDDARAEIRRKLRIFKKETKPVIAYYRARKVLILKVNVGIGSTALQMLAAIKRKGTLCLSR